MKTDKWLYFRSVAAVASDDGFADSGYNKPTSICIPASSIASMYPTNDTALRITTTPSKNQGGNNQYTTSGYHSTDYVDITIDNNKHKEVMAAINSAATNARTPFIVIADDVTGEYIHSSITDCLSIVAYRFPPGVGLHEYYEITSTSTAADADGEVCAQLDMKIPAEAILLEAAITTKVLAAGVSAAVRLDYHSATTANGSSAAGTEWIGAGSSGTTSIPDADLSCGATGGIINDSIHSGTADPIDRDTAETFLQIVAGGNITAVAYIGVYVKWFGGGGSISY